MIVEVFFNVVILALSILCFYYISYGKKYESDFEKNVLSFFSLGLFFMIAKALATIAVVVGATSFLLSANMVMVYSYITAVCFIVGAYLLKDVSSSQ
ncbi:MAG: hypothetical protein V1906_00720 [Candidatus Woesearchaeota archaeon]